MNRTFCIIAAIALIITGIRNWRNFFVLHSKGNYLWANSSGDPVWGTIALILGIASLILNIIS